jgi:hypothetical protein
VKKAAAELETYRISSLNSFNPETKEFIEPKMIVELETADGSNFHFMFANERDYDSFLKAFTDFAVALKGEPK